MRADKDPIAFELARQYKVLMPNLSLTNQELGDLVEYLEAMNRPRATSAAPRTQSGGGDQAEL
jgi:cytochrome c1